MKLMQLPTSALLERIEEEIEVNPTLDMDNGYGASEDNGGGETDTDTQESDFDELDDAYNAAEVVNTSDNPEPEIDAASSKDIELDDYIENYIEEDPIIYKSTAGVKDEEERSIPFTVQTSFAEHLTEQLSSLDLDDTERIIAEQIIGSIDSDGYLRRDIHAMVNDLAFSYNIDVTPEQIEKVLKQIQQFDPLGVAARNLQECLTIQLEHLHREASRLDKENKENIELAIKIINKYFDAFTKKHYDKLGKGLGISTDRLKKVINIITSLNPKPASGYNPGTSAQNYIVPDFFIENKDGKLELTVNSINAPDLRVSDYYKEVLTSYLNNKKKNKPSKKQKETINFIKSKIDSAKWFIDAIKQRYNTMLNVMYSIMQLQSDYFLTGDPAKLRPMILKDIADMTGLDISTVSRVANSKYVQTEFGTKLLKEFFSESMQTESGDQVSTHQVKNALKEIIAKEDKKKPLSDEKLMSMLKNMGYNIARRTVAKYREQLGIPVARMRKKL